MNLKKFFAAGALLAVSGAALAEPVIPPGFEDSATAPADAYAPPASTNDGALYFYLYDNVGESTYSLNYWTGLTISDISPIEMDDAGFTLEWNIDTSSALAYGGISNLVWGVSAGDHGSLNVAGDIALSTTVNVGAGSITSLTNGQTSGIVASTNGITNGNNEVLGALDIQTVAFSTNDVLSNYSQVPDFNWTADAEDPSATLAMYRFAQNGARAPGNATNTTLYAGVWSFDLAAGILRYTVGGGSEVPLPAALWLLLSGLGGMGIVSRRKSAAVAAA